MYRLWSGSIGLTLKGILRRAIVSALGRGLRQVNSFSQNRLLRDVYRVGLAGLKAALQETHHYAGDFKGLHSVEIIKKIKLPFTLSNESASFASTRRRILTRLKFREVSQRQYFGAKVQGCIL